MDIPHSVFSKNWGEVGQKRPRERREISAYIVINEWPEHLHPKANICAKFHAKMEVFRDIF